MVLVKVKRVFRMFRVSRVSCFACFMFRAMFRAVFRAMFRLCFASPLKHAIAQNLQTPTWQAKPWSDHVSSMFRCVSHVEKQCFAFTESLRRRCDVFWSFVFCCWVVVWSLFICCLIVSNSYPKSNQTYVLKPIKTYKHRIKHYPYIKTWLHPIRAILKHIKSF